MSQMSFNNVPIPDIYNLNITNMPSGPATPTPIYDNQTQDAFNQLQQTQQALLALAQQNAAPAPADPAQALLLNQQADAAQAALAAQKQAGAQQAALLAQQQAQQALLLQQQTQQPSLMDAVNNFSPVNPNANPAQFVEVAQTAPIPAAAPVDRPSAELLTWNFFKGKGLSDAAVAGIMGNISAESGFNTSAVSSSGTYAGMFQWGGGRRKQLESTGAWNDINTQLNYAWLELSGSHNSALHGIQNASSASAAADQFRVKFEGCGDQAAAERRREAERYYNQFHV